MSQTSEFNGTVRFDIRRRLGAGGMGVVYEALDREHQALVALKTLRDVEPQAVYRLKHEFRELQDIQHPNLVSLGELFEVEGRWFFTMELIQGLDFLSYVRATPSMEDEEGDTEVDPDEDASAETFEMAGVARGFLPYDETRLRSCLAQLSRALIALHAAGKIHRDVKPSNTMVTREGRLVLLDFGLVVGDPEGGQSTEGVIAGTAAYMAPEQAASGSDLTPAIDWYGVGVMLYEALTHKLPFGGTRLEMLLKKQHEEPPPPRTLNPALPDDLDALCTELLRFDPARRPSGREVLRRLGIRDPNASAYSSQTHVGKSSLLLGRERELVILGDALSKARTGACVGVTLRGESGLGKSALVQHFAVGVQELHPEAVVLKARCYERESVPYKAFDGIVDSLSRFLRKLPDGDVQSFLPSDAVLLPRTFPVLGRVELIAKAPPLPAEVRDQLELRARVFAALRELLARIGARRTLILCIDDMQWADADSHVLLEALFCDPDPPSLLLLATTRDDAGRPALPVRGPTITVDRLTPEAATEVARQLIHRAHGEGALDPRKIAEEAQGHPLFIGELVQHLAQHEDTIPPNPSLDDAIRARVAILPEESRRLLLLAAVAGAPLPQRVLRVAAQLDPATFARQAALLRVAHLLRSEGKREDDQLDVYHNRIREALLLGHTVESRLPMHERLALALETEGGRPELLIDHLEACGQLEKAGQYARRAAATAMETLAFDHAVELFRTAIRLSGAGGAPRELRIQLGMALVAAARGPESADVFLEAAQGADPAVRLDCHRRAAEQLMASGHTDRGLATLSALLADIGVTVPSTPTTALLSVVARRVQVRLRGLSYTPRQESQVAPETLRYLDILKAASHGLAMVDNVRGSDFNARFLIAALGSGEVVRVTVALATEVVFLASQKRLERARRLTREVLRLAERGDAYLRGWGLNAVGSVAYFEGKFRVSAEKCAQASEIFRNEVIGANWERDSTQMFRIFALRQIGSFAELRRLVPNVVREAAARGNLYGETTVRRYCAALYLADDDLKGAADNLAAARWQPPEGRFHLQHWFETEAHGEEALYGDTARPFLQVMQSQLAELTRSKLTRVVTVRSNAWWLEARLILASKPSREELAHAERLARNLRREGMIYTRVYANLVTAAIEKQRGHVEAALEALRDAARLAEDAEMRVCAAVARLAKGKLLGGTAGAQDVREATATIRAERVKSPDRFARIFAPGFD